MGGVEQKNRVQQQLSAETTGNTKRSLRVVAGGTKTAGLLKLSSINDVLAGRGAGRQRLTPDLWTWLSCQTVNMKAVSTSWPKNKK